MTTGDYYQVMAKTAGVKELKAKLSQYLRDVKHGETVLVTEHGQVVAKLVPLRAEPEEKQLSREEREARQLLADGLVSHLGTQDEGEWPAPRPVLSRGWLQAFLDEDRKDRV
ncbi:MAG TPA: type II toxin-antitoxin system prevent-host-death family antitoxin [Myxococcales bacterium]|nr:type II toxin-antitoxin system prevent-host-death family antitoxin [Myxococcales bacterium]